jgi:CcmD family protein
VNSIPYLYAAYIATGAIHAVYLVTLFSRYQKLKREMQDLQRR